MKSRSTYTRSSSTIILGTLVALFFAINFLTFVNRNLNASDRSTCATADLADVRVIRVNPSDAALPVAELEAIERDLVRARHELEHARRKMKCSEYKRARAALERAERQLAEQDRDARVHIERVERKFREAEDMQEVKVYLESIQLN